MREDSFIAQRPAGINWLHVHPEYLVTDEDWEVLRLARNWREGVLPEAGGVGDQSAWTVAAIETVLTAWQKLQADRDRRSRAG